MAKATFCLFLLTPVNTFFILFHVHQLWLSIQATENNRFCMFGRKSAPLLPMFEKALANHFPDAGLLFGSLTSLMSEYFFFVLSMYLESIDQILARELNYLIFLFDNDL